MENDVKMTISKVKNGQLSKEECVTQMNRFESLGKLCEFSKGIVDLSKEIIQSNNKSTEALATQSAQLGAIIADKTISNSEKEYAKELLAKIVDEIAAQRKADRDNQSWLVKTICATFISISIAIGWNMCNKNKKS